MLPFQDNRLILPDGGDRVLMQVTDGVVALRKAPQPDATQVSQALFGETLILHHEEGEFGLVQGLQDGYVGWALMDALSAPVMQPTHRVTVPRLHAYVEPRISAPANLVVGIGAQLTATGEREGRYLKFERAGWIVDHLVAPKDELEIDPAAVAERYLATPYLWGGRDGSGLDCSGLVQIAFGACGVAAPRDSDMQREWFGDPVEAWDTPGALRRNDLICWKDHIGILLDAETLLHANGTFMSTIKEPLWPAIERIATEYGEPLGARRIDVSKLRGVQPPWLTLPE